MMPPKTDSPWWVREARDAMKGYGLAVVIVLSGLAFTWMKAGAWLDAKAESERALATAFQKLVSDNQEFQRQVLEDHRRAADTDSVVVDSLKALLEDHRKNAGQSPPS